MAILFFIVLSVAFRDFSSLRTHFWAAYEMRLLYADKAYVKNKVYAEAF